MNPAIVLSLGALAVTSCFADDAKVKMEIQSRYAELSKSFSTRNAKAFERFFTDSFTAKAPGRPLMTRKQTIADFEGQMKVLSDVKWVQVIRSLKSDGKVFHVQLDSHMSASAPGKDGKKHTFKLEAKNSRSDWVKSSKGWQIKYSETGSLKMWVDGQPISDH